MIELADGFAPPQWQQDVGTVTVIRADHKPLTKQEIETIWMYQDRVLDYFGDGPARAYPQMTKEKFRAFCEQYKRETINELGRREFEELQLPIGR